MAYGRPIGPDLEADPLTGMLTPGTTAGPHSSGQTLEDILFAPAPEPAPPTKQERLAQMLIGLGDIANIIQNRKPGRNLPVGYAREFGERRKAERTQEAQRGDEMRRRRAAYDLQRQEREREHGRTLETERTKRALELEEKRGSRTAAIRQLAAGAGIQGVEMMDDATLLGALAQKAVEEETYSRGAAGRTEARLAEEAQSRQAERLDRTRERQEDKQERRDIEGEQVRKEQRGLLRSAMSDVARVKVALRTKGVVEGLGKPSDMTNEELRQEFISLATEMGLDEAGTRALMKQVDQDLFRSRGISPPAKFDLYIPKKGIPTQYMSPDGLEFSAEPQFGWVNTTTGKRVGVGGE